MSLELWKSIFDWATIVFIALTVFTGAGAIIIGDRLGKRQFEQSRQFDKDLTAAKSTQQRVEIELTKQKERTASAEKAASDAALALAKFKEPRTLTLEQQGKITAKVKPFAGMTFDVAASNKTESFLLLDKIEDALAAAGWEELNWASGSTSTISRPSGKPSVGFAIETGVSVQVEIEKRSELLPIAKVLAAALTEEGIAARAELMPTAQTNSHDSIHIVVGDKPQ